MVEIAKWSVRSNKSGAPNSFILRNVLNAQQPDLSGRKNLCKRGHKILHQHCCILCLLTDSLASSLKIKCFDPCQLYVDVEVQVVLAAAERACKSCQRCWQFLNAVIVVNSLFKK